MIVGTLLGDTSMPLDRGKPKLHVEFQQTIARGLYIWHLYERATQRPPNDLRAPTLALAVGILCRHTSTSPQY